MFKQIDKKRLMVGGLVVALIYFLTFGFLFWDDSADWVLKGFFDSVIGVFMGAGAIGLITSILFIFQAKIQSDHAKHKAVFENKLALYQKIISDFQRYLEDSDINEADERELFFTQLRVLLLSSPATVGACAKLIDEIREDEGNVSPKIGEHLLKFILHARDDLDVQDEMKQSVKNVFDTVIDLAKKKSKRSTKRTHTNKYKVGILDELDVAQHGEASKILDRENLYWSQISAWRKLRKSGELN